MLVPGGSAALGTERSAPALGALGERDEGRKPPLATPWPPRFEVFPIRGASAARLFAGHSVRQEAAVSTPPSLITSGKIAEELGAPLHRVLRVLATRAHIKPVARAGMLRLYSVVAIAQVRHELNAIDARRDQGGVA